MQWKDLTVTTEDGSRVAVRDFPDNGPPVLLLHGAGLNLASWNGVAALIADRYHLVAIDLLGHGESSPASSFSMAADLSAVNAVITALALPNPAIVGHSYGGLLGVRYAAAHPECPVVINLDGLAGGRARPDHFWEKSADDVEAFWEQYTQLIRSMLPTTDSGDDAWLATEYSAARAAGAGVDDEHVVAVLDRGYGITVEGFWSRRPASDFIFQLIQEVGRVDMFSDYRSASCPVVLGLAMPDADLPGDAASFLSAFYEGFARAFPTLGEHLPSRRLASFTCGHMIPIEAPAELASLMLRTIPPRE